MLTSQELSQIAAQEGVPLSLLLAVYHVESSSGTDPRAKIPHDGGVVGPFQVQPATFEEMVGKGKDINNEYLNAVAGARYLKQGLERHGGDPRSAYLYYHGGPNQANWGPKTNAAADKVMSFMGSMNRFSESIPSQAALSVEKPMASASLSPSMTEVTDYNKLISQLSADTDTAIPALGKSQQSSEQFQADYNKAVAEKIKVLSAQSDAHALIASAINMQQGRKTLGAMNTLSNLGLDDEQVNNLQARLSVKMASDVETLSVMRADLSKRANEIPGFLQNPLGWIIGNLQLKPEIAKHNNLLSETTQDKRLFDMLTSTASNLTAVNAAKSSAGEASKALAEGMLAQAKVDEQMADIKAQAAQGNQTFANKEFEHRLQVLRLRQAHVSFLEASQNADERRRTAEENAALKQAKVEEEKADLDVKNKALKMIGYPPVNSMATYKKLPKHIINAAEIISASGGNKFGQDIIEAYGNARLGNPQGQTNDTRVMVKILDNVIPRAKESLNGTMVGTKLYEDLKPEQQRQLLNERVETAFVNMQKNTNENPNADFPSNPYRAPPVERLLEDPVFAKTKLAASIRNIQKVTPGVEITPEFVIATAKAELANGANYSRLEDVVNDLHTYFVRSMELNNQAMSFTTWNLPIQTRFGVGGKDWAKRSVVTTELAKTYKMIELRDLQLQGIPGA